MQAYKHLSDEERYTIKALLNRGISIAAIARELGRSKSTVTREIKRNSGLRGYRPKQAQEKYIARRYQHSVPLTDFALAFISYLIRLKWSPEQIHKALKSRGWIGVPSYEWIYQWVYTEKLKGGKLYQHLRCQKTYRKRRLQGNERRNTQKPSIHTRPAEVDSCEARWHFEGDTIVGAKHQGFIVTLVERQTMYLMAKPMLNKQSAITISHCKIMLNQVGAKSVTFDNGTEFSDYEQLIPWVDVYFADAYKSNQRAKNENTNRLIRQYLPKKVSFLNLSEDLIDRIVSDINNRPRKNLGWKSPNEVLLNGF